MKLAIALLAALAFAALPLLTSSNYIIGVGISALIFTVAAAALNLIYGFTGLLSFAQLGFWGIGGYATALTVVTFGGNFWWGVVWAALLNAVVALAIGYPTLRTNRHAFVIIDAHLRAAGHADRARLGRPHARAARHPQPAAAVGLRLPPSTPPAQFYWVAWAFSVAMLGFLYALCSSRIGRTLVAIKQNEPLVRAQGISPMPYKLASFAISAAITGAAGGVFTFHLGIIDPLFLDFYYMQTFLIIVIIGGAGSFWGVVVAGIALSALPEVLRFSADFRMIIYGVILVVAMFVMPSGVAGWLRERQLARMREAAAMSAILEVTDLRKAYAGVHALDGVSFAVEAGSITGLIGPNGSGKSTAIDCISGFQKLDGGKVVLAGVDITGQPAHHIARAGLMRTFQTVRIYERLEPARQSRDRRPAVRRRHLGRRVPAHPALSRGRRRRPRRARASWSS